MSSAVLRRAKVTCTRLAVCTRCTPENDCVSIFLPGLHQSWSCWGRRTWPWKREGVGERRTMRPMVGSVEACDRRHSDPSAGTAAAGTLLGWCEGGSWTRDWWRGINLPRLKKKRSSQVIVDERRTGIWQCVANLAWRCRTFLFCQVCNIKSIAKAKASLKLKLSA